MSDDYTPTTFTVRNAYAGWTGTRAETVEARAEFDRWLADVRGAVLADFEYEYSVDDGPESPGTGPLVRRAVGPWERAPEGE